MVLSFSSSKSGIVQSKTYQTLHDQGCLLLSAGRYKEALTHFDQAIGIMADQADSWYRRGDALVRLSHYQKALFNFDQALALDPKHQQAWAARGAVLIYLERYTEALESCDRALILQPQDSATWVMRGAALHRLNRYKQAYASYDKALGIERKPLSKRVAAPTLSLVRLIKTQLSFTQPNKKPSRQKWAMLRRRSKKQVCLNGWAISMGLSLLVFSAILCVGLISLLQWIEPTAKGEFHATGIPWIQDAQSCQESGRFWEDGTCWDQQHDPSF